MLSKSMYSGGGDILKQYYRYCPSYFEYSKHIKCERTK